MKNLTIKIILWLVVIFLLLAISYGSFFLYKLYSTGSKVSFNFEKGGSFLGALKNMASGKEIKLAGLENDRVNVLLMGIAGKGKPGQYLTDTIMILSLNTKTNQVALISLPRDFYLQVPDLNIYTKINSVYPLAINRNKDERGAAELLKKTVSEITALDINYYVVLNFDGFEKAIDSIGGINVINERDIYDPRYPGPGYSYEVFELKKGFHHLNGKTALKYARERHDDPQGDFGRAKRQQQVMQSTKNKIFSMQTMLNAFALNGLLSGLGENVRTDIAPEEVESFLELGKRMDTENINNVVVDAWNKDSLLKVSHIFFGSSRAFILVPRVGNLSEIQELSQNVFDLNKIKRKKEEIARENATVAIINRSADAFVLSRIKSLLIENFSYKNVMVLSGNEKVTEEKTIAYDLTNGTKPFTLNEIAEKLPAEVSYVLPGSYQTISENTKPEIIIVLGKDIIERYNMEEDSIEEYKRSEDQNGQEYLDFINKN